MSFSRYKCPECPDQLLDMNASGTSAQQEGAVGPGDEPTYSCPSCHREFEIMNGRPVAVPSTAPSEPE